MIMAHGDDCTDLVSDLLPTVETEEGQMTKNEIYKDMGAIL